MMVAVVPTLLLSFRGRPILSFVGHLVLIISDSNMVVICDGWASVKL